MAAYVETKDGTLVRYNAFGWSGPVKMVHVNYDLTVVIGQPNAYSAVSVIKLTERNLITKYEVIHLERFPLGSTYHYMAKRIKAICQSKELIQETTRIKVLGASRAVQQVFKKEGVKYFTRHTVSQGADAVKRNNPSRTDMIITLATVLQDDRLQVSSELKEADALITELANLREKASNFVPGNESPIEFRALSVALPVHISETGFKPICFDRSSIGI